MIIVENHITQQPNDKQQVSPTLTELALPAGRHGALPEKIGKVDSLLADAGYNSEANVNSCEAQNIVPYIAGKRESHNQPPACR